MFLQAPSRLLQIGRRGRVWEQPAAFMIMFECPVCFYGGLTENPWDEDSPSFEICPCCGVEFGYDDFSLDETERARKQAVLRKLWEAKGFPWFSRSRLAPVDWDPALRKTEVDGD
jgi:hypothetical protein